MDEIDLKLIEILRKNGRLPNAEIARTLKVSEGTIRRRLKYLFEKKLMQIVGIPNFNKMGFSTTAMIALQTTPSETENIASQLRTMDEIWSCHVKTGTFDIFIYVAIESSQQLGQLLRNKIGTLPGVKRTETFVEISNQDQTIV